MGWPNPTSEYKYSAKVGGTMYPAIWHGTLAELAQLEAAVQHHCTCASRRFGASEEVCSAHSLLSDPRLLDHLIYAYRARVRFQRGEWTVEPHQ